MVGVVNGHPNIQDGHTAVTTPVVSVDGDKAVTQSGTEYELEERKEYEAHIVFADGEHVKTKAYRDGARWMVGGDVAKATSDLGAKIFIHSDGKVYWLKGNRLIFQDNVDENLEEDLYEIDGESYRIQHKNADANGRQVLQVFVYPRKNQKQKHSTTGDLKELAHGSYEIKNGEPVEIFAKTEDPKLKKVMKQYAKETLEVMPEGVDRFGVPSVKKIEVEATCEVSDDLDTYGVPNDRGSRGNN